MKYRQRENDLGYRNLRRRGRILTRSSVVVEEEEIGSSDGEFILSPTDTTSARWSGDGGRESYVEREEWERGRTVRAFLVAYLIRIAFNSGPVNS